MRTKVLGSIAREVCNYQRIRPVYIRVYRKWMEYISWKNWVTIINRQKCP
jgi:hypothetical protein